MKKSLLLILILLTLIGLYLFDLFFHLGYTSFLSFHLISPLLFFLIFLVLALPSYLNTMGRIKILEARKGIKISVFYYLDKVISSILFVACIFIVIVVGLVLINPLFLYALYYPRWWLIVLIPACSVELFRQKAKLKRMSSYN